MASKRDREEGEDGEAKRQRPEVEEDGNYDDLDEGKVEDVEGDEDASKGADEVAAADGTVVAASAIAAGTVCVVWERS